MLTSADEVPTVMPKRRKEARVEDSSNVEDGLWGDVPPRPQPDPAPVVKNPKHKRIDRIGIAVYGCILAVYASFLAVAFVRQETVKIWRMESHDELPAVGLAVQTNCLGECDVAVRNNYNTFPSTEKCGNATFEGSNFDVDVCYSWRWDDGLNIHVENFRWMSVELTHPKGMHVEVHLEPTNRKTVFVGQNLKERRKSSGLNFLQDAFGLSTDDDYDLDESTSEPFGADFYYDGHTNNTATARLLVRATQFANVASMAKAQSPADLLASIGGIHALLWAAMVQICNFIKADFNIGQACCTTD